MFNTKKEKWTLAGIVALCILISAVVNNGVGNLMDNVKSNKVEKKLDSMAGNIDSIMANTNTLVLDADTLKASADTLKKATREIKAIVEEDLELDRNTNEVVNGCTPPRCGGQQVTKHKPAKRGTVHVVVPEDTVPARHDTVVNQPKTLKPAVVIICCTQQYEATR